MKDKKNVVIAVLAILAVVFGIVSFTGGFGGKQETPATGFTQEDLDAKIAEAKEGLFDQEAVDNKIAEVSKGLTDEIEKLKADAATAAETAKADLEKAVADAKEGLFDQEALNKAVEDAKAGLFDQEALDAKVAEAKKEAEDLLNGQIEELTNKVKELEDKLAAPAAAVEEAVEEVSEQVEEKTEEAVETVEEKVEEAAAAVEGSAEAPTEEPVEEKAVMAYADYAAAELESEVTVETYVQATQSWWNDKITVYAQSEDGAYFIYNMACSEEDAAKLVPGAKIRVSGYKSAWSGEVEIIDATFELIEGDAFIAEPEDVTALLGTEELINSQNKAVAFKGVTVEPYDESGAAFAYKDPVDQSDDLYFKVSKDGAVYDFCVEFYLCGKDTEVYKAVEALNVGDVIDIEAFLYWYNGANPHVTKITKAE